MCDWGHARNMHAFGKRTIQSRWDRFGNQAARFSALDTHLERPGGATYERSWLSLAEHDDTHGRADRGEGFGFASFGIFAPLEIQFGIRAVWNSAPPPER